MFDLAPPRPLSKRDGKRVSLPKITPDMLAIEVGVPKPARRRFCKSNVSKYDAVFAGLPVNGRRCLPILFKGTLVTYIKKLNKRGAEKYSCQRISDTECAVWRDA